ncbi:alpha/beta hydrolase [Janthinobacterium sp. CG_S6]|uniref:alpha/beta hydrolase n=1 Tax=Janthinobacterium sp. CG_S6 TaxID=3071707 RepID=UPI002E01C9F7|nr:esterase/lipase superfamily enzyme [Janthinobacterium sp. CG_S6]
MDLVTSAIIAAIENGSRAFVREVVALSYTRLKTVISRKVADPEPILEAIASLELDPDSVSRQFALRDTLNGANVSNDIDVLMAAQTLLYQIKPPPMVPVTPAAPPPAPAPPLTQAPAGDDGATPAPNYAVVKVFFATDRNLTSSVLPAQKFGALRSELSYGSCEIGLPRDQRMGELEAPTLWRLEWRENPDRHVVLLDAKAQDKDLFLAALSARIQRSGKKSAFLFVHGYNVTFEDAARRTGQMCYDLAFDGAPVFYSWPSQGKPSGYLVDEANIEWSQSNLTLFLLDFLDKSDAQHVYVIGHNMGNRALTHAVAAVLAQQPVLAQRITEIILTAPDIDAGVFKRDIAPALAGARNPITLYASSEDMALSASKAMHGYPRAGDSGAGLLVVERVETIDATGVDTGMLEHTYFAEKRSVLSDIFDLIKNDARPDQRFLEPVEVAAGRYWSFKK